MATVLILGATSDIAVALAKIFASKGYALQLASRRPQSLTPGVQDLRIRYGVEVTPMAFDAVAFESHRSFWENLNPKPEITVCVFGLMEDETKAWDDWSLTKKMIDTNYTGAVSILDQAAKYYQERKQGTVVGISSVAGERGRQSKLIYGSAKAGFTAYLSGLRNYLRSFGVQVLTVKPGFVYTRMTEGLSLPKLLTARPEEVAARTYQGIVKKRNVIYVKWVWRWIMLIIKSIPESMFKKMNL